MFNPLIVYWGAKHWGRAFLLPLALWALLSGCANVQLVSAYDAQIDTGVSRYAQDLETYIAKMAGLFGQPEGAYAHNRDFYAEQAGRLGALILRAESTDPGKGCVLSDKAAELLGDRLPAELKSVAKDVSGNGDGCTVRMLKNLKIQLGQLAELQKTMQGLNSAAAVSVLNISSQAIRAVLAVEALKKKGIEG